MKKLDKLIKRLEEEIKSLERDLEWKKITLNAVMKNKERRLQEHLAKIKREGCEHLHPDGTSAYKMIDTNMRFDTCKCEYCNDVIEI